MRDVKLRAGIFLAPYHPINEDPTLCLDRDLELVSHMDRLGFAEAWFGEHHSAAYEISSSPELMIAAAAQRTKRIKLGTGVVSLPYHNPLMVANRLAQLDHLTFGRLMFGAGPGLLASDAHMLGLDVQDSRRKLDAALSVITRLLRGEWVTERYDNWYDLRDAHCQMQPFQREMELAVASAFTTSGGKLAAKYGAGLLCFTAGAPGGRDALAANWEVACEAAAQAGRTMNPASVRCVVDIHLAETRSEAIEQARAGWERHHLYVKNQSSQLAEAQAGKTMEQFIEEKQIVIGTPEDAIEQIRRLEEKLPNFGCLLICEKNFASPENQKRSVELFARHVLPAINGDNRVRQQSFDWARANSEDFMGRMMSAAAAASQSTGA